MIVDGEAGQVIARPICQRRWRSTATGSRACAASRRGLDKLKGRAAISRDGVRIRLLANIELPEDARVADEAGAEGVGLYLH